VSLYELVFKPDEGRCAVVLFSLGFVTADVGRFRDAWAEIRDGQPVFAIYTRNGGGNRQDQAEGIRRMQSHDLYVADTDDQFDSTYATFYFTMPPEVVEKVGVENIQEHVDTDARWLAAIEAMKTSR